MAPFSWFRKKPTDEDYEQVLASLALSIQKRQTKLSELRLRERRATLLVTAWAFAGWVAYVGLWWTGVVGRGRGFANGLWGVPVVLGPLVILFTRRIIQLWYARKGNAEEKTLKTLLVQQRNKIEEIKKKTNYYTTKNLLERYDEGPVRRANGDSSGANRRGPPPSIQASGPQNRVAPTQQQLQAPLTPSQSGPQGQPFSPVLSPLPIPRKQWYDKVADALLGDDTASTGPSPASRYALICERCFSHNGLVKEEQWEHAQYVCPKCGHFNASQSQKAGGSLATSPITPSSGPNRPSSTYASGSQSAPPPREPSPRPPLSASTVLVEKSDAEPEDAHRDKPSQDGDKDGEGSVDMSMQMEVDT